MSRPVDGPRPCSRPTRACTGSPIEPGTTRIAWRGCSPPTRRSTNTRRSPSTRPSHRSSCTTARDVHSLHRYSPHTARYSPHQTVDRHDLPDLQVRIEHDADTLASTFAAGASTWPRGRAPGQFGSSKIFVADGLAVVG